MNKSPRTAWHFGAARRVCDRLWPGRVLLTSALAGRLGWALRPRFLQRSEPGADTLFAGPWVGEFGWELMNWQGLLRRIAPRYDRVIVSCRPSSTYLYRDFCRDFVCHSIDGTPNCHIAHGIRYRGEIERIMGQIPSACDHLLPLKFVPAAAQDFVRYGTPVEGQGVDVLVHARARGFETQRNWDAGKWNELLDGFRQSGATVGAVGLRNATLDLDGVREFRDMELQETVNVMASSRLVLGPSSGPMHLASLCGTPHLVWTDRGTYGMGITSREKYASWWNPLRTRAVVLDQYGFDPPVGQVLEKAVRVLEERPDA